MSLAACNSDDLLAIADNDAETPLMENFRSEDEAIEIATKALNEFYPVTSRSGRDLSQMNVVLLNKPASRNSDITNPLYVVNFGNESGYAIISADKETEPLLAVTESGSITSLDNVDNPGLRLFLDGAIHGEMNQTTAIKQKIDTIGEMVDVYRNDTLFHAQNTIAPRLTVKWGQRYPEGELCPNGICGCVATAAAQALSYFKYPETLKLTYPERNANDIVLDWDNMKRIDSKNYDYWRIHTQYDIQLSTLCRELGHQIEAKYKDNSTSASLYKLMNKLMLILPLDRLSKSEYGWAIPETNKILKNGIILMAGAEITKDENGEEHESAHAWIIDGYIYKNYTVRVFKRKINMANEILDYQFDKTELYSHVNWGWNGQDNGYFSNSNFNPSNHRYTQRFEYFAIYSK